MHSKPLKYAALNISAATTELVQGILALYPEARLVPRVTPLEDEDISLEVALPLRMEEIYAAREADSCLRCPGITTPRLWSAQITVPPLVPVLPLPGVTRTSSP